LKFRCNKPNFQRGKNVLKIRMKAPKNRKWHYLRVVALSLALFGLTHCDNEPYNYLEEYSRYTSTERISIYTVDFAIAVPNNYYSHPRPMPLVLALHYGGTVTEDSGVNLLAELVLPALGELEAIFVAPVSPSQTTWISTPCERVIFGLIDTIKTYMQVDPAKIIITGYSMGANGVWYYVNKYPNYFATALPVSGNPGGLTLNNLGATPIYAIHSKADEVFLYDNVKTAIEALQAQGVNVHLKTVTSAGHYETTKFAKPLRTLLSWIKTQLQ